MKRFCMRASISTAMRRSASNSQRCSGVTATQLSPLGGVGDLDRGLRAPPRDPVQFEIILEQGVVEGHAAPNDGRIGIMAEDDAEMSLAQPHGDGRGDLVSPKAPRPAAPRSPRKRLQNWSRSCPASAIAFFEILARVPRGATARRHKQQVGPEITRRAPQNSIKGSRKRSILSGSRRIGAVTSGGSFPRQPRSLRTVAARDRARWSLRRAGMGAAEGLRT